ncbi:MAG: hypothetical protein HY075_07100 [Deltaproteobacteria bacterium]|nr:hypothetical protein [Deltaproteobacteria bacterium]
MKNLSLVFALGVSLAACLSCSSAYKDMATTAGQQSIIDQANDFLTAGNCEGAIGVLKPLVDSPYVNYEALMVYSSAYSCRGGINMAALIGNLKDLNGSDVWGVLIKTNYSTGADGHLAALDTAWKILCQAANPIDYPNASARNADQNVDMIFIQANIITTVIAPLGNASSSTGKKGKSITGLGTKSDKCHVQVALAELKDSLQYVSASASLKNISDEINTVCASVAGGCPLNESLDGCLNDGTNVLPTAGGLIIDAIDTVWN